MHTKIKQLILFEEDENIKHLTRCKHDDCYDCDIIMESYSWCEYCHCVLSKENLWYSESLGRYVCNKCYPLMKRDERKESNV